MRILQQQKYAQIKRQELKVSVMDRSTDFRLRVEDQNMTQFHSDKTKQDGFIQALRDDPKTVPKSLKASSKISLAKRELTAEMADFDY